ncbi:MAG: DNA polymerase/3'-5' exonuclease PolX [Armatimonadetes bacterium]|nr:DNA polymerase/3'-5' exonuclease PolX [Armatimonadota bacterium]
MVALENQRAAQIFTEIAEFLELKGENPFKIRAYQRAARAFNGMDRSLAELHASGELLSVPGVGKNIADKVAQLLDEGRVELHERLAAEFPPQLLDLMDIPGLGPKKAATLYRELRISSVPELEQALREGRIRALKGFGARSETNLLEGIRRHKTADRRLPLGRARDLAADLAERLTGVPGVERVVAAGSVRRWRETAGDLDLLCQVQGSPEGVIERFCGLVPGDQVSARGDTRCSLRLGDGFQVDLRIVPGESFGAALQYFTGSKDHNVALRNRAEKLGYKLNEYGLFDRDGKSVAGETEEGVYQALGMPFIPPEIRETGQEIALALEGALPDLIRPDQVQGNLHTHSTWSDGSDPLGGLAGEALRRGYEYLAVTDHSRSLAIANGLTPERLLEQCREIDALNSGLEGLVLLKGTECDILGDGSLDFPDELLSQLDLVVASVHSGFQMPAQEMTRRILRAIENPHVDILAHPTGRRLGRRPAYEADWEVIFQAAARTGTALEVNGSPRRLDLSDSMARRASQHGVRIAIGTDAHSLREFEHIQLGVGVARRAWVTGVQVINTWPLSQLKGWLEGRS